jgi:hypothetical protein
MLALALVAIIIGCICLYLEVADYGSPPYQLSLSAPLDVDQPLLAAAPRCGPYPAGCSTST